MDYIIVFLCSFGITFFVVPPMIKLAERLDFIDRPTERKKHKTPVPLIGGVCMFIGFCVTYAIFIGFADFKMIAILLGGLIILSIGVVDDFYKTKRKEFAALPRALIQLSAAALVFFAGIRFTGFMNPFTDTYFVFPVAAQFVLTVLWIFGVTTVINFSDGLDGLAGGLSAISGATLFVTALIMGQKDSAYIALMLVGITVAFLKYNIFPAKIFMGDSGATFLGYMLAVVSLFGAFKQATVISVLVPILALGVPIFDNIFVVIRRFIERKPIYKADSSQIHYRLLKSGLNPVQTVAFLFLISVCLNLTSIIIVLFLRL